MTNYSIFLACKTELWSELMTSIKLYYCEWQINNQVKKELRMDRETFVNLYQATVDHEEVFQTKSSNSSSSYQYKYNLTIF